MVELLTGLGLASASGLNAYIPLLALGLLARFTDLITLPTGWTWLENPWLLGLLALLLLVDVIADKVPAVDSVNDVVQTVVRPASGGMVFASGVGAETVAVTDPSAMFEDWRWVPIAIGVVVALVVHLTKSTVRPVANTATGGLSAPVLSTVEDATSVGLVVAALVVPAVVLLILIAIGIAAWAIVHRRNQRRRERHARAG
ncbi:DUF4126 domain-containing protein [Salana multivorans]